MRLVCCVCLCRLCFVLCLQEHKNVEINRFILSGRAGLGWGLPKHTHSHPPVEVIRSLDALASPQVRLGQVHGVGVAATQTFSSVRVVQFLTVTKLVVPKGKSKSESEEETSG